MKMSTHESQASQMKNKCPKVTMTHPGASTPNELMASGDTEGTCPAGLSAAVMGAALLFIIIDKLDSPASISSDHLAPSEWSV